LKFAEYFASQPAAFTILVRADKLPWARLHPEQHTGTGATPFYEVGVTAWGLPVKVWRRATVDRRLPAIHLVNEALLNADTCRNLVVRTGQGWRLSAAGAEWLEILTYTP
jgi:hypothetical protein